MAKPDGGWQPPTGISPRPMLMGAPRNALRAFNAGVSLAERRSLPSTLPHAGADWLNRSFVRGPTQQSQKTLLGEDEHCNDCTFTPAWKHRMCSLLRQDHGAPSAGLCSVSFVIRLPVKFSRCNSALYGRRGRLCISRERLLSGDKNLSSRMHEWPVAEAWKGGHAPARATMGFRLFCLP